jgi:hypothetical protein
MLTSRLLALYTGGPSQLNRPFTHESGINPAQPDQFSAIVRVPDVEARTAQVSGACGHPRRTW